MLPQDVQITQRTGCILPPVALSEGQGVLWKTRGHNLGAGMTCRFVKCLKNFEEFVGLAGSAYKAAVKLTLPVLTLDRVFTRACVQKIVNRKQGGADSGQVLT